MQDEVYLFSQGRLRVLLVRMTQNIAFYKSNGIEMAGGLKDHSKHETTQTAAAAYYPCHVFVVNARQVLFQINPFTDLSQHHSLKICYTEGMLQRNSLQSRISAIRGDMELMCLIKCLTELAFEVQREFKQEGRDETCSAEGKKDRLWL